MRQRKKKEKVGIENCSGKLQFGTEIELGIDQLTAVKKHFENGI